uniref:Uncharacterized protein n=1 Tax=Oryza brachyantha TaxID=4533 RepID=J3LEH1_ORYBR
MVYIHQESIIKKGREGHLARGHGEAVDAGKYAADNLRGRGELAVLRGSRSRRRGRRRRRGEDFWRGRSGRKTKRGHLPLAASGRARQPEEEEALMTRGCGTAGADEMGRWPVSGTGNPILSVRPAELWPVTRG